MNQPMLNRSVTVIIVSYNSFDTINRCLGNWLRNPSCKIIIVDNASTDHSAEKIQQHFPLVTLLPENINLGYGRAANRALGNVKTPYALLLNPDVMATEEDIEKLTQRAHMLPENFAILTPAVSKTLHEQIGVIEKDWTIGAVLLFNMKVLSATGFFDENIFLFYEETDLCKRIRSAGYPIYLDTDLYIEHLYKQSSTPSQAVERLKNWHMGWSAMYYRRKHNLNHGNKTEWRVIVNYFIKAVLATKPNKRLEYRAKLNGSLAFKKGISAFQENGKPQPPQQN